MKDIESINYFRKVCDDSFDDADLLEIVFCGKDEIYFKFVVSGIPVKYLDWVDVRCCGIFRFDFIKHPKHIHKDESELYVDTVRLNVFEDEQRIKVLLESTGSFFKETLPKQVFQFEAEGTITIKVVCPDFTLSERRQIFNNKSKNE